MPTAEARTAVEVTAPVPQRTGAALPFDQIWLVDFEFGALDGDVQRPVCMVAQEHLTGQEIRMWEDELAELRSAPFDTGPRSVLVAYYASAELGCFETLRWPRPANIIDLFAEFRVETNGLKLPAGRGLLGALAHFGLGGMSAGEKESMRELIMGGGPWSEAEKAAILAYCAEDVRALGPLLDALAPRIATDRTRVGHAVLRGRYMASVAAMEHAGIPVDTDTLLQLRERWSDIQDALIADVDSAYGVYEGRTFKAALFADWLARNGIPWPRLDSGALALDDDTFREMARARSGSLCASRASPCAERNAPCRHSGGSRWAQPHPLVTLPLQDRPQPAEQQSVPLRNRRMATRADQAQARHGDRLSRFRQPGDRYSGRPVRRQ